MTPEQARDLIAFRRSVERAYQEITERRLTEIDPEWRDHYKTMEAAELAYRWEMAK